jgi:crossover junction endodeoxyribonuclease RuvC
VIVCGIDPGLLGALAFLDGERDLVVGLHDLPVHKVGARAGGKLKLELDAHGLTALLRQHRPNRVVIERVSAMPRQGLSSTFRFAYVCGTVYGAVVALGLPVSFARPQDWQRHHRIGRGPDDAVRKVLQLYPALHEQLKRQKDNHRADAVLIALFGAAARESGADLAGLGLRASSDRHLSVA